MLGGIQNDNLDISGYNKSCDKIFGKVIRGEITMDEYKKEQHRIDAEYSSIINAL